MIGSLTPYHHRPRINFLKPADSRSQPPHTRHRRTMALRPVTTPFSTCCSKAHFRNMFFLNSKSRFLENLWPTKDKSLKLSGRRRIGNKMVKACVKLEEKNAPETGNEWGKVSAVLFDMDGVLCNSEELSRLAAVDVFAEMGVQVTVQDFVPFMGTGIIFPLCWWFQFYSSCFNVHGCSTFLFLRQQTLRPVYYKFTFYLKSDALLVHCALWHVWLSGISRMPVLWNLGEINSYEPFLLNSCNFLFRQPW